MSAELGALAAQAVAFLSAVGTNVAAAGFWDWLKGRFAKRSGGDALARFRQQPTDEAAKRQAQATLLEALQEDETFRRELAEKLDALKSQGDVRQTIVNVGDSARNIQIAGSGNEVKVE